MQTHCTDVSGANETQPGKGNWDFQVFRIGSEAGKRPTGSGLSRLNFPSRANPPVCQSNGRTV